MCLLNVKLSVNWKCVYWPKMCLLSEKMSIEQKKKKSILTENMPNNQKWFLINENVSINWKGIYWTKMCLLNENMSVEGS